MNPSDKTDWKRYGQYCFLLLVLPGIWVLASYLGMLKGLESLCLRALYAFRGEQSTPVSLIYVDLDARAIELMGERPFPRIIYAEIVKALFDVGQVKAIGIDIVFSDAAQSFLTDPQKVALDNAAFRAVIESYPNVVLAAAYTPRHNILSDNTAHLTELPLLYRGFTHPDTNALPEQPGVHLLGAQGGTLGLINVDESMPLTVNTSWVPMFAYTPGPTYHTLALQLLRIHDNLPASAIHIGSKHIELKDADGQVLRRIPLTLNQLVEVNWFSRFLSPYNPRFSMADVLFHLSILKEGEAAAKEDSLRFFEQFKDAIVLIGPIDPILQDLSPTSMEAEPVPRVGIHGNLLKTLITGQYVERWPMWVQAFVSYVVSVAVFVLAMYSGIYSSLFKITSVMCLGLYLAVCFWAFKTHMLVLPIVAPLGAALSASFVGVIYKLIHEEKQKSRIKNLFGTYVSPELVSQMVEANEEPKLGGMETVITAFFSDIQNFSTFSEKLPPNQLVELMNEYLTAMTDILQAEKGTLDKYIGDAIVAMFGAPVPVEDHAYQACLAAYKVQVQQALLRQKWSNQANKWPQIVHAMHTRIGLNTGLATVGNMGSTTRFNYTMMGDTVNLAARCESAGKQYGVYTLATEMTQQAASARSQDLVFRFIDQITVKGRTQPVKIYEIVGLKHQLSDATHACIHSFQLGLDAYLSQNWDKAIEHFQKSSTLEPLQPSALLGIETNPSLVFFKRCHIMKNDPPPSTWDGVYHLTAK